MSSNLSTNPRSLLFDRLERHRRVVVGALLVLALCPPIAAATRNLPYYQYIDEGHLVLWTRSIFAQRAPDNIFYGPLLYYLYAATAALVDPFVYLFGGDGTFFGSETLTSTAATHASYQDVQPWWMLLVARGYSIAFFAATILLGRHLVRRALGAPWGLVAACLLASMPVHSVFAAFAQPELAIVAGGALLLWYAMKHWERGFGLRATVTLAVLVSLLASLKIYTVVYACMGLLPVLRPAGGRRVERAIWFVGAFLLSLVLLYLPYRTPQRMLHVIEWAHEYYALKPPGSLFASLFRGGIFRMTHWAIFCVVLVPLVRRRLPVPVALFAALVLVNTLYFLRLPFDNPRNVVLIGVAGAIAATFGFRELSRLGPARLRVFTTAAALVTAAALATWTSVESFVTQQGNVDSRLQATRFVADQTLTGSNTLHVAHEAKIHRRDLRAVGRWVGFGQGDALPSFQDGDLVLVRGNEVRTADDVASALGRFDLLLHRPGSGTPRLYRRTLDPELFLYRCSTGERSE